VPVNAPPPAALPPPPTPPDRTPLEDTNGPSLIGGPPLEQWGTPQPGCFASVEADLIGAHVKNRLRADVTVAGLFADTVHVPNAQMEWGISPRIELGYRFAQGYGELLLCYHSLVSDGRSILTDFDPTSNAELRSRLNVDVLDLDYAVQEFALGPFWNMKWQAGVRYADIFFDSWAEGAIFAQRTSNHFFGAGPHFALNLRRSLPAAGLSLYARVEGAAPIGRVKQGYEETFFLLFDGVELGGATRQSGTEVALTVHVQAGLAWAPTWRDRCLRLSTGYDLEQWYNVGQVHDSRAELTAQGLFFRCEWNY
jgi:hypothetical protein